VEISSDRAVDDASLETGVGVAKGYRGHDDCLAGELMDYRGKAGGELSLMMWTRLRSA
jgi:hypothetical protein